uniref:Uncharacterized protein n=1 Tax=Oryza brachyantha TaxID=4533 RepID=J3MKU2_ORYBR
MSVAAFFFLMEMFMATNRVYNQQLTTCAVQRNLYSGTGPNPSSPLLVWFCTV